MLLRERQVPQSADVKSKDKAQIIQKIIKISTTASNLSTTNGKTQVKHKKTTSGAVYPTDELAVSRH